MGLKKYALKDRLSNPRFKVLVYGPPGAGKTTFAATVAQHVDMSPVLVANIDKGALSIASVPGIDGVDIHSTEDLEELFWLLANRSEGYGHYKTVILDGISEMQKVDMEAIASKEVQSGKRESVDHREIQDYGESISRLERIFRQYRDLANRPESPLHIILTAWDKKTYPKVDGRKVDKTKLKPTLVGPDLSDKLGNSVTGFMDFVWYLGVDDEGNRRMLTQTMGAHRAKTRGHKFSDALGPVVDSPNMAKLYDTFVATEFGADD